MLDVENPSSHDTNSTATLPDDLIHDANSSPQGPPQRVLVVEDLDDSRASLVQLLEMALGLEVDAAENGEQALKMLGQRTYSLVITDLRMPKVGGMKLIHEIRERDIPVTIDSNCGWTLQQAKYSEQSESKCFRSQRQSFRTTQGKTSGTVLTRLCSEQLMRRLWSVALSSEMES